MTPAILQRLPSERQRLLALALLVLVIAVVAALALGPVIWLSRHYDRAIADASKRLQIYERIAAQAPEYRKALGAMEQRSGRRFYLTNTAANLAGAEMQELVKGAIESNGGRITTSQNVAPRDDGRFREIVVSVQFFATTPNLQKILLAIETHQPYLVIDNLTIRPLNAFRGFKPGPGQEPELNVHLEAGGWTFPQPAKVPPKSATATPPKSATATPMKAADGRPARGPA